LFFEKLKDYALKENWYPNLDQNSSDFLTACGNRLDEIKRNPIQYFKRTSEYVYNSDVFDCIGVLSLTTNPLSRTMWAHYGNNSKGFCIGFDTINIFKDIMPINFGKVDYICEAMNWSFLNAERENLVKWLYKKHIDWSSEKEYRFITSDINENNRTRKFNASAIKEILVGPNMQYEHLKNIITELKQNFDSKVDLYKVIRDTSSYKIGKQQVAY